MAASSGSTSDPNDSFVPHWKRTSFLPQKIDNAFKLIAVERKVFSSNAGDGDSVLDATVEFSEMSDVISYLPRALQIGLLAPFPNFSWPSAGSPSKGLIRKIVGIEMLISYAVLALLILELPGLAKKTESFCIIFFAMTIILLLATGISNVGALYRYRYGFYMLLIGFAVTSRMNRSIRLSEESTRAI